MNYIRRIFWNNHIWKNYSARIFLANASNPRIGSSFIKNLDQHYRNLSNVNKEENNDSNHIENRRRKYINERMVSIMNWIMADINARQDYQTKMNKPNAIRYPDPFKCRDQILQDLIRSEDLNDNYNIHDLIEQEFQLEISDSEFESFKNIDDITEYVIRRWNIRDSLIKEHSASYKISWY